MAMGAMMSLVTGIKEFLEEMTLSEMHLPPPPLSDERAAMPTPNAEFLKYSVGRTSTETS